jgi:hypothetical protein
MGEIKSTLDLVMARTRHLSLSEEDRARQKRADFEKRLQGLLQRYEDGDLSAAAFLEKFAGLQSELKIEEGKLLPRAVLNRIDPEKNNEGRLALLERVLPFACDPLRAALAEYREKKAALQSKAEQRLLERLARSHGITGSAVVPNPGKDSDFRNRIDALKEETRLRIVALQEEPPSEKRT